MSRGLGTLTITGLFGLGEQSQNGDDRLLDLYWNRAQLKKEYVSLRKDRYQLLDALTEEEGKTARLKQKIEYLEDLLGDPETASSTLVYYRLRKIWRHRNKRLLVFSSRLREQCELRESMAMQQSWAGDVEAKQLTIARRLADRTKRLQALQNEADFVSEQVGDLGGIFNIFRRRSAKVELETLGAKTAQIINDIAELKKQRAKLAVLESPQLENLSLENRRAINLTVLSLALTLAEHYSAHGIAELAKAAIDRPVGATIYGSSTECEAIVSRIDGLTQSFDNLEKDKAFVTELKRQAHDLQCAAAYNKETDAIPTPGSLNEQQINVLAEDYWSLSHAMLL